MSVRVLCVLLALCLTLTAFAQDADRILLRYQWNAGDEITWQITSETTGTVTMRDLTQDPVAETTTETWSRATMPLSLVVESVDAEGNGTVSYRNGPIDMDRTYGGQQQYVHIDPEAGTMTVNGEEQPIPEQAQPGLMGETKLVMSPRGEVIDVQVPEGSWVGGMVGGFDMAQLLPMSRQSQITFPEQPVPQGYCWRTTMAAPFGEGTDDGLDTTMVLTLAGMEMVDGARCARIGMVGAIDISEVPLGMEMKLGPMHMSVQGSMLFDPAAGRMVSGDFDMLTDVDNHISGTAEGPEGPQPVDMEIQVRDMLVKTTMTPL